MEGVERIAFQLRISVLGQGTAFQLQDHTYGRR